MDASVTKAFKVRYKQMLIERDFAHIDADVKIST